MEEWYDINDMATMRMRGTGRRKWERNASRRIRRLCLPAVEDDNDKAELDTDEHRKNRSEMVILRYFGQDRSDTQTL